MCKQLREVTDTEFEELRNDVRSLKRAEAIRSGWLKGVGLVIVLAQLVGGFFVKKALDTPEDNAKAISSLQEIVRSQGSVEYVPRPEIDQRLSAIDRRQEDQLVQSRSQFLDIKGQIIRTDGKIDKIIDRLSER
jgi:hypothetical protein